MSNSDNLIDAIEGAQTSITEIAPPNHATEGVGVMSIQQPLKEEALREAQTEDNAADTADHQSERLHQVARADDELEPQEEGVSTTGDSSSRYSAIQAVDDSSDSKIASIASLGATVPDEFLELKRIGVAVQFDARGSIEYPIGALGPVLAPAARAINETVQAPLALCGHSLLGAASLAVQGLVNVQTPDGRLMPTSLYLASIAESGERKTHVDNLAMCPVLAKEIDLERHRSMSDSLHERAVSEHESQERELLDNELLTTDDVADSLEELGEPPSPPCGSQILLDDPTFEGLLKAYEFGRPSMGLFSDEGGRTLGGYAMSSGQRLKTIAGLSKLWDGKPLTKTTAKDGTIILRNRRLAGHLMFQPVIADKLLKDPIFLGQGFLPRCLIVAPASQIGYRRYRLDDPGKHPDMQRYFGALDGLLQQDLQTEEHDNRSLVFRVLSIAHDALGDFAAISDWFEQQSAPGARYRNIRGFGAKAAEQATRIAGVLAMIEDPEATEIRRDHLLAGTSLAVLSLETARIKCGGAAAEEQGTSLEQDARAVLNVIRRRCLDEFPTSELARYVTPRLRSVKKLEPLLHHLCGTGELSRLDGTESGRGQRGLRWCLVTEEIVM